MIGTAVLAIIFVVLINIFVYLCNSNSFPRRKFCPLPTLYFASNRYAERHDQSSTGVHLTKDLPLMCNQS